MDDPFNYNPLWADLHCIANQDVVTLLQKDKEYGSSWKRRGGVGSFMMLARKWDRIETQVKAHGYDIFAAIREDSREEGLLDDIRDLRRYLMLVEQEMTKVNPASTKPDGMENPFGFNPEDDLP
jgi:hypothetical protein